MTVDDILDELDHYWRANGQGAPLSKQLKKRVARALPTFTPKELLAANQPLLRDAIKLTHPRPVSREQSMTFRSILRKEQNDLA